MKQFYTDKDIEELHRNGVTSLQITDDIVLTDLAYEKARRLGVQLVNRAELPPAAPVRPYLSEGTPRQAKPGVTAVSSTVPPPSISFTPALSQRERGGALEKRIREQVAAKLGNQIEASLLDTIIKRTLKVLGMK